MFHLMLNNELKSRTTFLASWIVVNSVHIYLTFYFSLSTFDF